jgi:molecular chaperone DnaK (HSP70)
MLFLLLSFSVRCALFIGFDIGTDTIKAAVLRSGRSIEIVLNEQSKRKTPALVSLETNVPITTENVRNIERRLGIAALPVLQRNRSAVIRHFPDILGKHSSPDLQAYFDSRLLDFNMEGTLVNGIEPHVALAMLLQQYAKAAENQLQQGTIRDAVVAVPSFFTNAQRLKVAAAVKLIGLNLLKIINEKDALALVYALEKTNFFTREPRSVAIVDWGHGSLKITGYKFSAKIIAQKGRNPKPVPKVEELGYAWDDHIGGVDIDVLLSKHLSAKYGKPITNLMLEEAQKLKHALTLSDSANLSLDSVGQRVIVTREEFKTLCEPLFAKITALAESFHDKFDSVEFVGGSSRIPAFQDLIAGILGPPSRSLNSDESIVTGAAYAGAMASGAFKLMDVNHEASSVHSANLSFGSNQVRLFSIGSGLAKLRTARLDAANASELELFYVSKVPAGTDDLIGKWSVIHEGPFPEVSRIVLSFIFNTKSAVELSKSQLFVKNEQGEISQTPLDVRLTYRPMKFSRETRLNQKLLITAFTTNDLRLGRIAEARNTLESQVFELRDAITSDPVWLQVTSPPEKITVRQLVNDTTQWLETNHEFEDETPLKEKARIVEESVRSIAYRVQESRTRESSVHELEYVLNS